MVAIASTLSVATMQLVNEAPASYPMILWAHNSLETTEEFDTPLSKADVLSTLNSQADKHNADLVAVAIKNKLST